MFAFSSQSTFAAHGFSIDIFKKEIELVFTEKRVVVAGDEW